MNSIDRFSVRLKAIREGKGLNQEDFGALGGVKKGAQGLYETGKSAPSIEYLYKLAEHGVNIAHLLTGQGRDADPVDVTFMGEIGKEVEAAYRDAGLIIGESVGAGQFLHTTSEIYCDLAEIYETIDECRSGLKAVIRQFRRNLASPVDIIAKPVAPSAPVRTLDNPGDYPQQPFNAKMQKQSSETWANQHDLHHGKSDDGIDK